MVAPVPSIIINPERGTAVTRAEGTTVTAPLPPGSVVSVTVRQNYQGQSGVFYQGGFLPAELPQNLSDGAKLTVQVMANIDSLVLKILDSSLAKGSSKKAEKTIGELLKQLFPDLQFSELPNLSGESLSALPKEVRQLLENLAAQKDSNPSTVLLEKIFSKLSQNHLPLNPEDLKDPEQGKQALIEFLSKSVTGKVDEAITGLKKLSEDPKIDHLVRFLTSTYENIELLLKSEGELTFPEALLPQLQNKAQTLPATIKKPTSETKEQKIFSALMNSIFDFNFPTQETSHEGSQLVGLIRELNQTLSKLHTEKANSQDLKSALGKINKQIEATLKEVKSFSEDQIRVKGGLELLEALRQLTSTNDVLRQINSCVGALGEPTLFVIPAVIDGKISQWTLSVQTPTVEDEAKRKNSGGENFVRLSLNLDLPGLGAIGVDMAYRMSEILVSFTVENPELNEFIGSKMPLLEKSLKEAGFEKLSLGVRTGMPEKTTPNWYQEITKRSIVA